MLKFIAFFLLMPNLILAQTKVDLIVHIPKKTTDSLFIAGNFNDWNPEGGNYNLTKKDSLTYFIHLNLPKGNQEFKITRGSWDKAESKNDGKPIANRTLNLTVDTMMNIDVANWTDNFKQVKEEYHFGDHVHIVDSAFFIPQLNKHRQIWIYLPKDYSKSKKKYPVIYMQDGQNLFHANPPRPDEWAVDSVMDSLIKEGSKEMIIVGIDHGGKDRLIEYNPYDSKYGKGEGKAYVSFLVETLKPFIDSNYRTLKDVKNTSIAGSSMGGLISMYAIAEYPKVFGSAGVFSPAFWLAPKIYDEVTLSLPKLSNNKVFFVAGDKEGPAMVRDMKKVYGILNSDGKNKNVALLEKEDGKHTEWFWHREFVPFYQFITK
ncbi:alpha/beta hydrolase-fold protein [Pedobacter fastidiosus]|uniref:Phosphonate ABC transporter ATP-binding protein n=1 Tax=Pedobacter fastidiosus TaxID=2765361 RepID=A0ABR7KNT6_9SPHI|nr:alpha/beta hydrolase-fold protein [Pedobacter fastidiosus]MBC6109648.1 phosphonate ABC transporter ATP-binding protein [Pedobacter fastidiosus]